MENKIIYKNKVLILSITTFIILIISIGCNSNNEPRFIKCGGAMNHICPIGTYCNLDNNCGGIDRNGICSPIPEKCDQTEDVVCGCDGKEYLNECTANTLSISVNKPGNCIKKPEVEVFKNNE